MANRFSVGYRFKPNDIELINCYLLNKITGNPLPDEEAVIESDLYNESELLKIFSSVKGETKSYFFVKLKKKNGKGSRIDRTVGKNGTWNSLDCGKPIFDDDGKSIGLKRSLDYKNKGSVEHGGCWNMKEYSLHVDAITTGQMDYVLCVLKKKSRGKKRHREDTNVLEHQILLNTCEDETPNETELTAYFSTLESDLNAEDEYDDGHEVPGMNEWLDCLLMENNVQLLEKQQTLLSASEVEVPVGELTTNVSTLESDLKAVAEHDGGDGVPCKNNWFEWFAEELKGDQLLPLEENDLVMASNLLLWLSRISTNRIITLDDKIYMVRR